MEKTFYSWFYLILLSVSRELIGKSSYFVFHLQVNIYLPLLSLFSFSLLIPSFVPYNYLLISYDVSGTSVVQKFLRWYLSLGRVIFVRTFGCSSFKFSFDVSSGMLIEIDRFRCPKPTFLLITFFFVLISVQCDWY